MAKNLAQREIPSCFFKKVGGEKPTKDWYFEDFAKSQGTDFAKALDGPF
ncbi:DUF6485 family protein [Pseudobutyrivibrio sp. ACV-2]